MNSTTWTDQSVVAWVSQHGLAIQFAKSLSIRAMPTLIAIRDGVEVLPMCPFVDALRKCDVDLDSGPIAVRRSYDAETTKGGHADVVPIAPALEPYLRASVDESKSALSLDDLREAVTSDRERSLRLLTSADAGEEGASRSEAPLAE